MNDNVKFEEKKKTTKKFYYIRFSRQGHAWLKDDEATSCKQCQKEFSIARRKVGLFQLHLIFLSLKCIFRAMSISSPPLCCSTTVETVETSTATVVLVTSWPCPRTLGLCGCATCATPSCCREAPPRLPDTTPSSFY